MTCALSDDRSRVSCLARVRCRSGGEFGGWALGAYMRDFAVEPRSGNVTQYSITLTISNNNITITVSTMFVNVPRLTLVTIPSLSRDSRAEV